MGLRADFIEGLQIMEKHDPGGFVEGAEHDIVYGPHQDQIRDPRDRERLKDLGWFVDSDFDCWAYFV